MCFCLPRSVIDHNSNPSAVILPDGLVVLAYRYTFRSGSEIGLTFCGKTVFPWVASRANMLY